MRTFLCAVPRPHDFATVVQSTASHCSKNPRLVDPDQAWKEGQNCSKKSWKAHRESVGLPSQEAKLHTRHLSVEKKSVSIPDTDSFGFIRPRSEVALRRMARNIKSEGALICVCTDGISSDLIFVDLIES